MAEDGCYRADDRVFDVVSAVDDGVSVAGDVFLVFSVSECGD